MQPAKTTVHPSFPLIADILRRELSLQGFHVHVRSSDNEIVVTDVVGNVANDRPTATPTFVVKVGKIEI